MLSNKEADLVMAVLMYAVRCVAEGDQAALRAMSFGPKEIDALQALNIADMYRIETLRAHCLTIDLDREVFWRMVEHLQSQRASEELQQTLIKADAPFEMMQALFGVGSKEYTRWRRLMTLDPAVGRPAEPDEAGAHALWYAWDERVGDDSTMTLSGEDYLSLHETTGVGLRVIWGMTQRWAEFGNPEGVSPEVGHATQHGQ